jgi:hypothetical protein
MEISIACNSNLQDCEVSNVKDVVIERQLPDFKLVTQNIQNITRECFGSDEKKTAQVFLPNKLNEVHEKKIAPDHNIVESVSEEYIRHRIYSKTYIWILVLFLAIIFVMTTAKIIYEYNKSIRRRLLRIPRDTLDLESGREDSMDPFYEGCRRDHRTIRREGRRSRNSSVTVVSPDNTLSIEDLGGFSNPSFGSHHENIKMCSKSCDSCEYKTECKDRGICLSTYRLLA